MKYCFVLLFSSISICLSGQINWQDSTAQAITYWGLYDSVAYEVELEKIKIENGDTVSYDAFFYDVGVTVIDSTESSYVIQWHYYNFNYEGLNPMLGQIMNISEDIKVEIITNEFGAIERVRNWEEVRDYTNTTIEEIVLDENVSEPIKDVLIGMKDFYKTEEGVRNTAIQDALQFHAFYGSKYDLGQTLNGMIKVANLYSPSTPFDASLELELTDLDEDQNSYSISYKHVVDQEQLMNATMNYLKSIGMPEELMEEIDPTGLTNSLVCKSELYNDGWLKESKQVKVGFFEESQDFEIRVIKIK